ncbi:MAG: NfeD family protein [Methanobrevibacter sp.]|nr:NfeD family protein [Methanobrevibacter sp.]
MFSLEFWLTIAVLFILGELLTNTFFLLSIGIGAGFAGLANYLNFDPTSQLLIFIIVTIIAIIASRPLANRLTKNSPSKKSNSDRLIGKEGIVIEEIKKDSPGTVKLVGDTWKAIANENIPLESIVMVEKVDGVKLIVKKKE